jgi:hypothetical protein
MSDNLLFLLVVVIIVLYKATRYLLNYLDTRKLYAIVPTESLNQILIERERMNADKRRRSALMWAGGFLGLGLGVALGAIIYNSNLNTIATVQYDNAAFVGYILLWIAISVMFAALGVIAAYFIDRKLEK